MLIQDPVERDVDTWILNNWVLGSVFDEAQEREIAAHARKFDDSSTTEHNESVYLFLKEMTRQQCLTYESWESFMNHPTVNCVSDQQEQLCRFLRNSNNEIEELLLKQVLVKSTYFWARYLTDRRMRTYFDVTEQLGVQLQHEVDRPYECGEEIWALVGELHPINIENVLAKSEKGERWSFYGTSPPQYLSGPVSLINHACHKHSNVIIKPVIDNSPIWLLTGCTSQQFFVAIAETRICAGDRIYATYDQDERELRKTRGMECNVCFLKMNKKSRT